jgi:DnaK suppressor protein
MSSAGSQAMATSAKRRVESDHEDIQSHYPEFNELLRQRSDELLGRESQERAIADEQVLDSPGDAGDSAVMDNSKDHFLNLAENHRRELEAIDDAFDKMRRGEYGFCDNCSNEIAIGRLRQLPYAKFCIDCQALFERERRSARLQTLPKL